MAEASMKFSMDNEMIKPVIEAHIQTAIVEAMKGTDNIVEKIVKATLMDKVSSNGTMSKYSSDNQFTFLDWLCRDAVKSATKEAMKEVISKRKHQLKKEIKKQMEASQEKWVQSFLTGLGKITESAWRFNVNISLPED